VALAERASAYPGVMQARARALEAEENRNVPAGATVVPDSALPADLVDR
jgi:hypothetical protein